MSDRDEDISHADLDWLIQEGWAVEDPPVSGLYELKDGWEAALLNRPLP